MDLKITKVRPNANLPARATEGAAGFDLRACCEDMVIAPMQRELIPTGVAIQLPDASYVALVFARSGLAIKQGLAMANGVGVIDSDYRGELMVPVVNLSQQDIHIANGERIAQMLIMPVCIPDMIELSGLDETQRGAGGFGSTGVK